LNDHFREIILPTAINMDTVDASDIFATLCHDRTRPLARRRNGKGTLDISIDDHGLKYRFELANT
jgi:phage head maturation protease